MDTNGIKIRLEKKEEYREVENLVREAFWNVYRGVYQTPQGYYVRDCDVEEFDKEFPPKKKLKLPGQLFK